MASVKHPAEIRGTDITPEQLESASQFLALLGWREGEPNRKTTRADIARIVAWYGALRFQSGFLQNGSLEKPSRLIETTSRTRTSHAQTDQPEFEILELTDIQIRPLVS
jgi:hypothetical protein